MTQRWFYEKYIQDGIPESEWPEEAKESKRQQRKRQNRRKADRKRPKWVNKFNTRETVLTKHRFKCFFCGEKVDFVSVIIDTLGPEESDLITSCRMCNQGKKNLTLEQFRAVYFQGQLFWGETN